MIRHYWPALIALAIALVLPAAALVYYAASTGRAEIALARSEERAQHERAADAIAANIRAEFTGLLDRERQRLFIDYNYFAPWTNRANLDRNPSNFLAVSRLANGLEIDPRIRSFFQVLPDETLSTPLVQGNPAPEKWAVDKQNRVAQRLRRVGRAVRLREEGRLRGDPDVPVQTEAPQRGASEQQEKSARPQDVDRVQSISLGAQFQTQHDSRGPVLTDQQRADYAARGVTHCVAVDKPILDATRNSAQIVEAMNKAMQGDQSAQARTQSLFKNATAKVPRVPVLQFEFDIVTLDAEPADTAPIICALRRIEEADPAEPRTYHQGFELSHDYLVNTTFPNAISGVVSPNFTARVALRTTPRDASIVRDLGRLLPTYELRAGPVDPDIVAGRVESRRRRDRWVFAGLAAVVAGALFVFWRLFRAEFDVGRRRQEFVSAVTHELKTPLTSIRMYSELLEDRWVDDPEKQQEYHGTIRRESERLSRLIGNVLDFSRLERGRRMLEPTPVDPADVVCEAVAAFRMPIEDAGGSLDVRLPEASKVVAIDRDALTQIVINLVDNAIKYGRSPSRITVDLAVSESEIELGVENDGEPIPRGEQRAIFEDFRRGRDSRVAEVTGVGLGLALVRRLAHAHRGRVACTEPRERDVRFEVRLRPL